MSSETHTAIVNATLVIASLAFVLVVATGYVAGASMSSMAVKGLSSLAFIGMLGWVVLRLVSLRSVVRELPQESDMGQVDENPFSGFRDGQL